MVYEERLREAVRRMNHDPPSDVSTVLQQIRAGNVAAQNRLAELIYDELRNVAARLLQQERSDHTLQPTALVNEAFVRLLSGDLIRHAPSRKYFFAAAARAMRQVLVDHARRRSAGKRQQGGERVLLDESVEGFGGRMLDLLALHEAMEGLAQLNERQSRVVELRFFGGFTVPEVAELLDVSISAIESDFRKASAYLRCQLGPEK